MLGGMGNGTPLPVVFRQSLNKCHGSERLPMHPRHIPLAQFIRRKLPSSGGNFMPVVSALI